MHKTLGPAIVAIALHAALMAAYVAAFGGDVAALVCAGTERIGRAPYEAIHVGIRREGYDGQFYYALARDPWHRHGADMDCAPVRQARILYPATSWLLSGGDARRLLWAMPLVNLLAIGGLAGLGALLAWRRGLSPWWGVLLPLAVNVAMPALRDLTDVLSTFLVCGLLLAWLLRWPWWSLGLWAAGAMLCREPNVAVVVAVFLVAAWQRRGRECVALVTGMAVWGAWIGTVWALYGESPFHATGEGHFGAPLAGMLTCLRHLGQMPSRLSAGLQVMGLLLILAEIGLALYLMRYRADLALTLVALGGAALAVLGGYILYEDHWGYTRAFAFLPLGVWLLCAQLRWRGPLVAMSLTAVLPLAAVVKAWVYPG